MRTLRRLGDKLLGKILDWRSQVISCSYNVAKFCICYIKVGLSSHHWLRRVLLVGGQSKELRIWYGGEGLFFQKIVRRSTNLLYI